MIMLFLILCMLSLGPLALGAKANFVIAIVLLILGALVTFTGFDARLTLD